MSTPAKLVPEATSGAPAADPTTMPDPDRDASEAVAAALAESGADRTTVEGPGNDPAMPERGTDGRFVKPADKPAEKPAAEPKPADATPAPAAGDEADLDLNLTAEELAEIEKTPLLRRMYKVMRRGVNKTIEGLAEQRKANAAAIDMIAAIRADPVAGLRKLAAELNLPIGEAPTAAPAAPAAATPAPVVKTPLALAEEALTRAFPPEAAKALAPILVEISKAVAASELQTTLQPINEKLQFGEREIMAQRQEAMRVQITDAINTFGRSVEADGGDWTNEIQLEMSKLIGQVVPGRRPDGSPVPFPEYLQLIYNHVTANRSREAMKARQLARLRAAANASEPSPTRSTATRAGDQRITADMSDEDAMSLAVQQSLEEQGFTGR